MCNGRLKKHLYVIHMNVFMYVLYVLCMYKHVCISYEHMYRGVRANMNVCIVYERMYVLHMSVCMYYM